MKYFASLKRKDIFSLIVLIVIGFTWIMTDQLFIEQSSNRFYAFIILLIFLYYIQYWINKPQKILYYSNTLALLLVVFVILSSIVMHTIVYNDLASKIKHSMIIWLITGLMPYIIGLVYYLTKKK